MFLLCDSGLYFRSNRKKRVLRKKLRRRKYKKWRKYLMESRIVVEFFRFLVKRLVNFELVVK